MALCPGSNHSGLFYFNYLCYNTTMKQFKYIEEYLEVIAGHLDPVTGKRSNWVFGFEPIISLARYDVKVLESMAMHVAQNLPLTERQGELLVKIVLKYERQLANKLVDVSPAQTPVWRVPLRTMDYTRSLAIKDDCIQIRFPFSNELIDQIRNFSRESQGTCYWDHNAKVWTAALTEYNLSWLYAWATVNTFEIDPSVYPLMDLITEVEKNEYRIELVMLGAELQINNATNSLNNYINEHLGGFSIENLLRLVDMSPVLGYTVSDTIYEAISTEFGFRFYNLLASRETKINPSTFFTSGDFESILNYADQVQRWPVVIYEPDLSGRMLTKLKDIYGEDYDRTRYIHTTKPLRDLIHIPILISSAGMLFGGDKMSMLQHAEKIVYCAQDVYNKKSNKSVKKI